jgi:hypothetical protein
MNKKAKTNLLMNNLTFLIILVVFFVGMMAFVYTKSNGAYVWEDYYAKEIAKIIDLAKPTENVVIDVQKATQVASSNKVPFEGIFSFNNEKGLVCVKLSKGSPGCFSYVNNVTVTYETPGKWIYLAEPTNRLHFKILKKGEKNA